MNILTNMAVLPTPGKNSFILWILPALILSSGGSAIYQGSKTGELNTKIVKPVQDTLKKTAEIIRSKEDSTSSPSLKINTQINVNSTSSDTVRINSNTDSGINQRTNEGKSTPINNQFTVPVYNTPTPNPTDVQWQKDFDATWNQMQKDYNEAKAQTCAKIPEAPGCK